MIAFCPSIAANGVYMFRFSSRRNLWEGTAEAVACLIAEVREPLVPSPPPKVCEEATSAVCAHQMTLSVSKVKSLRPIQLIIVMGLSP